MRKSVSRGQLYSRRAIIFGGVAGVGLLALVSRLYYLQFVKAGEFKTLSENNRIKLQLLTPPRGVILDRFGIPLAMNEKNYRLMLDPEQVVDVKQVVAVLETLLPGEAEALQQILAKSRRNRLRQAVMVKEHLSWDELSKIEFHAPSLPGAVIDTGQVRYYPLGQAGAHLIGYVGAVAEEEMEEGQPLLKQPDFKIGKQGIEKMIDTELRGSAGVQQMEVNAHGLPVRELSKRESIPGKAVRLTIDKRLQAYAAERLGEESGAVIVMDVTNGDILTMTSMPAFDPNRFSLGISKDYWAELHAEIKIPLVNKAIAGQYPPGSTFKMLVGLAGLESGAINEHTSFFCPGHYMLGNHRFNCWKPEGHGTVSCRQAIAVSCDTFFYQVAQKAGIEAIAETAKKFGLGVSHELGVVGEKTGIMPTPEWKRRRFKQPWQTGDTVNAGIGQGYVLATPFQLAVMTARMANGGREVKPRLLLPVEEGASPQEELPSLGVTPEHLQVIVEGMYDVVNSASGTAYGKRIAQPGMEMGGKTGTSQVRRITVRGRKQETLPYKERHHALFVGFAPVNAPKYAVAVIVEHGGGGSAAAAPVARDVLLKAQQLLREPAPEPTPDNIPALPTQNAAASASTSSLNAASAAASGAVPATAAATGSSVSPSRRERGDARR